VAAGQRERQLAVALGTVGQLAIAGERELRVPVGGHLVDHAAIAALDQNVGDLSTELEALGNGEQMILTFGGRVLDQVGIAQLS